MLSITPLTEDSYPICVIVNKELNRVRETIYFTEPSRDFRRQKTPFQEQVSKYLTKNPDYFQLKDEYEYQIVPSISDSEKQPRVALYVIAPSNSGKSYQIAKFLERYNQQFGDRLIAYASANPIDGDKNYAKLKDKIQSVDVLNLTTTIDFSNPDFHNSIFVFDDCDSGFSVSMEDLDKRLTQEEIDKMTITDKQKAVRILKQKCDAATLWVNKSVQSFLMNGRKYNESVIYTAHKPFSGCFENLVIGEATGILLFPASIKKNLLKKFMVEKLSMGKVSVDEILNDIDWYQYDFLYVSHRSSKQFIITNEIIKILED